VVRKYYLTILL